VAVGVAPSMDQRLLGPFVATMGSAVVSPS
jgi:hypothetical protein